MNTTSTEQSWAVLQYTSQYSFGWDFGGMAIMDLKWVGWIPPVAIPNPDQPTLAIFWHIITSVPKWKVQNHLKFLFKDVFKNYVLNHFLNWKERESCSSADATSVHIDHSIFAMGFIHIPEIYCNPLPPQMVCTNIRIEWKTLGCTHFPEICFHLPSIWHEYQDKKKIPEIWFHPPNVWHKYQDRIENVAFYANHRNMLTPPRMFCTNIRIELSISKMYVQFNILDSILIFVPNIWGSFQVWLLSLGQKHNC